ncbi:hypothetical protein N7508_003139 [Penicillium antarcticum]|uniref:uncharacterized protein n=1 Tax=Penicillium antarcticum TaxID=416450 RepID=UPI0023A07DD7|nr:uncharacterized protein N7508_003139 [Penicillium antarcticum]KAJ5312309.1 hypothetical protein N7508_003139 [Penicillium antarcticum]
MANDWADRSKQQYNGNALVGTAVAIAILQIFFVVARLGTRCMQRMKLGVDDYLVLLSLVAGLAKSTIYIIMLTIGGMGYHYDFISKITEKDLLLEKGFFAIEILDYPFNITPAKIALLIFYVRIFSVRKFQVSAYIVGFLVLGVGLATFIRAFFECRYTSIFGTTSVTNETCFHGVVAFRILSPLNSLTGLLILVLPMPFVWKLHAPRGQKIALTGIFLLSGIGVVASILRMAVYFTDYPAVAHNLDPTWIPIKWGVLAVIEGGVVLIAACLMSIWPLLTRLMPRRVQATLSRHSPRHVPRDYHQYWYHKDLPNNKTPQEISRWREIQGGESSGNSPPSPSSLADLEDQRLSILADDRETDISTIGVRLS